MSIQFCAVRKVGTSRFLTSYVETWGHGSTMTGPLTDTCFELSDISNITGVYSSEKLVMFETADAAKKWIEEGIKYSFKNVELEVVSFADLDTIVEHHLLDKKVGE